MLVGGIRSPTAADANVGARRRAGAFGVASSAAWPPASRAVIAIEPTDNAPSVSVWTRRPSAPFLAHLIATDQHVPQARQRRRAEPAEATSVSAPAGAAALPLGSIVTRVM